MIVIRGKEFSALDIGEVQQEDQVNMLIRDVNIQF